MAWERPVLDLPAIVAGQDFSAAASPALPGLNATGQFLFVKLSASDTVVVCNGHDDNAVGISQGNSKNGDALQVRAIGVSKVKVGAANLKAGDEVGSDATGQAVKITPTATGANFGAFVYGVMMEDVSAGDIGTVLLDRKYRV